MTTAKGGFKFSFISEYPTELVLIPLVFSSIYCTCKDLCFLHFASKLVTIKISLGIYGVVAMAQLLKGSIQQNLATCFAQCATSTIYFGSMNQI